ncbi:MAG: hypothetical protein H6Q80_1130, partial [Deltaproteobacteria bacterium]|nr:hypothetical protein [Deltaproteobacteria bacterium]
EALKSEDEGTLRAAADKLIKEAHALAEHMYQQTASAPGGGDAGDAAKGKGQEGDVVDAEYEDPGKK